MFLGYGQLLVLDKSLSVQLVSIVDISEFVLYVLCIERK